MALAVDTQVGPDGLPAIFDGGLWFSNDRRFRWNGAAWVPANKPAGGSWLVKIGSTLLLVALLGYAVYTTMATPVGVRDRLLHRSRYLLRHPVRDLPLRGTVGLFRNCDSRRLRLPRRA
jgi:hypothetical protein